MRINLSCRACHHDWQVSLEPTLLEGLACPACKQAALPRAAADLAGALEDALAQLDLIHRSIHLRISLDSGDLPPDFRAAHETLLPETGGLL